jgi:hypothetical protein
MCSDGAGHSIKGQLDFVGAQIEKREHEISSLIQEKKRLEELQRLIEEYTVLCQRIEGLAVEAKITIPYLPYLGSLLSAIPHPDHASSSALRTSAMPEPSFERSRKPTGEDRDRERYGIQSWDGR